MAFRKRNAPVNSAQTPSKPGTSSQKVSKEGETEHPFAQKAPGVSVPPDSHFLQNPYVVSVQ